MKTRLLFTALIFTVAHMYLYIMFVFVQSNFNPLAWIDLARVMFCVWSVMIVGASIYAGSEVIP